MNREAWATGSEARASVGPAQMVLWVALAVDLSLAGMAFHTAREFGLSGLLDPATGMLPIAVIQLSLMAWWAVSRRRGILLALGALALLQLTGGAIFSVLPLPFLPFQPEQSLDHYVSHLVWGVAQVPLIALTLRTRRSL